jgi:hypothetical protein
MVTAKSPPTLNSRPWARMHSRLKHDAAWLHDVLRREGVLERSGQYLVQPLAANSTRADAAVRRTFVVWEDRAVLFHVTVGRGLRAVQRRHLGFAKAFPDLACHPLFLLHRDGVDIGGRDYFPGQNLEDALRAGAIEAEHAGALVDRIFEQLATHERPSTAAAALRELAEFGQELFSLSAWSDVDRLFLRELVLPSLHENLGAGPFRRRWSNGDFIARNLLVNDKGDARLIDYEFAARTHFFAEERLRFVAHSLVPETVKRHARALQFSASRFELLYSLLNHARLSARVLSDTLAQAEVAAVAARVAELVAAAGERRRSYFLAPAARVAVTDGAQPSPVEAKVYSSESGAFVESASISAIFPPEKIVTLSIQIPAGSPVRHIRVDPADRPGLVRVTSIVVRSLATGELLWPATWALDRQAVQVGGTVLRLRTDDADLLLLSTGDDPWLLLPPLDRVVSEPVRIEIVLRFDTAAAAVQQAATEIVRLSAATLPPARAELLESGARGQTATTPARRKASRGKRAVPRRRSRRKGGKNR